MIRVLRILEYDFSDNEAAQVHFENMAVPLNGAKKFGERCTIRSATIVDLDSDTLTLTNVPTTTE